MTQTGEAGGLLQFDFNGSIRPGDKAKPDRGIGRHTHGAKQPGCKCRARRQKDWTGDGEGNQGRSMIDAMPLQTLLRGAV